MEHRISATEASRNLADILSRVRYRQEEFILLRGGKPFARILPYHEEVKAGDLAEQWASFPRLSPKEAGLFGEDLGRIKSEQGLPRNPWDSDSVPEI